MKYEKKAHIGLKKHRNTKYNTITIITAIFSLIIPIISILGAYFYIMNLIYIKMLSNYYGVPTYLLENITSFNIILLSALFIIIYAFIIIEIDSSKQSIIKKIIFNIISLISCYLILQDYILLATMMCVFYGVFAKKLSFYFDNKIDTAIDNFFSNEPLIKKGIIGASIIFLIITLLLILFFFLNIYIPNSVYKVNNTNNLVIGTYNSNYVIIECNESYKPIAKKYKIMPIENTVINKIQLYP